MVESKIDKILNLKKGVYKFMEGMNDVSCRNGIPVWRKYALTISESASYFGIGEKKLRNIMGEHQDDGFVIQNGTKLLIKRRKFEEYLDAKVTVI